MPHTFDEDSRFCTGCTEDVALQSKIKGSGEVAACDVCSATENFTVSLRGLAEWLKAIWGQWVHVGVSRPILYPDSDKVYHDQLGDHPDQLITEFLRCTQDEDHIIPVLIEIMGEEDLAHYMDGGEPSIEKGQLYQFREVCDEEIAGSWKDVVKDLKHSSRFFNEKALQLFRNLFEITDSPTQSNSGETCSKASQLPILDCSPGSLTIFRARSYNSDTELEKIKSNPQQELGNPPNEKAAEGRMNPKGISFFYGAEDRATCIAELRPSLSQKIVSARFISTQEIKLLDMTAAIDLQRKRPFSPFEDDFYEKTVNRATLQHIHHFIAQPVLNEPHLDYLLTQAMAEYLAQKSGLSVDGLIFQSVQDLGGKNVVLFPHILGGDEAALKIEDSSLKVHSVNGINYEFSTEDPFRWMPTNPENF